MFIFFVSYVVNTLKIQYIIDDKYKYIVHHTIRFWTKLHQVYIYITSEKPVNDQSYGVLDRYGITILYK